MRARTSLFLSERKTWQWAAVSLCYDPQQCCFCCCCTDPGICLYCTIKRCNAMVEPWLRKLTQNFSSQPNYLKPYFTIICSVFSFVNSTCHHTSSGNKSRESSNGSGVIVAPLNSKRSTTEPTWQRSSRQPGTIEKLL